ncbi:hypothetical protein BSBH6_00834 [Bacillus subtilis]|nr:hypothetical protein BSBH6_00834 [Bacillus subtilis]RPK27196.1 hypothetical protein BH5_00832 [Bacillus subtilis]
MFHQNQPHFLKHNKKGSFFPCKKGTNEPWYHPDYSIKMESL